MREIQRKCEGTTKEIQRRNPEPKADDLEGTETDNEGTETDQEGTETDQEGTETEQAWD